MRDGPSTSTSCSVPEQLLVACVGVALDDLDEPLEALALDVLADLLVHARRVRPAPRRVDERERVIERDLLADRERLGELGLGLAREADDDVGRQREPRHLVAQPCASVTKRSRE